MLALVALVTATLGLNVYASTLDELELISGASSITIIDNGAGDNNPADGTIAYINSNFNGWTISVASGTSHAPGLSPFGLDLATLVDTCTGGGCTTDSLEIFFTDVDFSEPVDDDEFTSTFSTTQTGSGSASESAWFSNLDTAFSQQNLIGTIGPFSASSVGTASGGSTDAVPDYSLTLEQVFTDSSGTAVSYSADGDITAAVPEPASIVLFGSGLAFCVIGFRRRRLS